MDIIGELFVAAGAITGIAWSIAKHRAKPTESWEDDPDIIDGEIVEDAEWEELVRLELGE